MWFDARAKLAEIAGKPPATSATTATQALAAPPVSQMSQVSQHPEAKTPAPHVATVATVAAPRNPDRLPPDALAYLAHLRRNGPATYGAMASALGWGATRAWQAEARLRAAGLVRYRHGKAHLAARAGAAFP